MIIFCKFLLMSYLFHCIFVGACSETIVSISGENRVIPVGYGFNLSCKFTCLRPQHVAQIWREDVHEVVFLFLTFL